MKYVPFKSSAERLSYIYIQDARGTDDVSQRERYRGKVSARSRLMNNGRKIERSLSLSLAEREVASTLWWTKKNRCRVCSLVICFVRICLLIALISFLLDGERTTRSEDMAFIYIYTFASLVRRDIVNYYTGYMCVCSALTECVRLRFLYIYNLNDLPTGIYKWYLFSRKTRWYGLCWSISLVLL